MSLSGFRNSSPISWFFSSSRLYVVLSSGFCFAGLDLGLGFGLVSYFYYCSAFAFFFACFFLKCPYIVLAACSISLSGFRNSSPISWFFSSSRLYPSYFYFLSSFFFFGLSFTFSSFFALGGLSTFVSFFFAFAFFLACFFLKCPYIVVAACSMSLSGFRNSSPISWFFSSSLLYPYYLGFFYLPFSSLFGPGFSFLTSFAFPASFSFLAYFLACFLRKCPWIVVAATSMSLSGFINSSPISYSFSAYLSYPYFF